MVAMSIFRRLCSSRCPPDYSVAQRAKSHSSSQIWKKRIVERKLKWKSVRQVFLAVLLFTRKSPQFKLVLFVKLRLKRDLVRQRYDAFKIQDRNVFENSGVQPSPQTANHLVYNSQPGKNYQLIVLASGNTYGCYCSRNVQKCTYSIDYLASL